MASKTLEYRPALSTDADGILAVLEEVAPEIPLPLTAQAREIIRARVVKCCSSEQSCVAVDHAGGVVGFLLAEPDQKERLHHDHQALHLPYSGVTKTWRKQRVFHKLMEQVMRRKVALTATVRRSNRCGMAARLTKLCFTKISRDGQDDQFRWQPGT